jgi:flagellar basal body-associated protein FliL
MESKLNWLIRIILLVWFVATNVAILVPSYQLLFALAPADPAPAGLPTPPDTPPAPEPVWRSAPRPDKQQQQQAADYKQEVEIYIQRVNAYTQQVAAYKEHLAALKAQREAKDRTNRLAVYEAVVRNTLVMLVSGSPPRSSLSSSPTSARRWRTIS